MCNAWNHPPGCTCGWGGEGATGGGNNLGEYCFDWSPDYYRLNYISYTNPNARCPICNAHVFFYKSPFGGRVFFDDLGPPWPKHPCTDIDTINENLLIRSRFSNSPSWERDGWFPAILIKIGYPSNKKLISFRVFNKLNKRIVQTLIRDDFSEFNKGHVLFFYKKVNETEFDISAYNIANNVEGVFRFNYYGGNWK